MKWNELPYIKCLFDFKLLNLGEGRAGRLVVSDMWEVKNFMQNRIQ